MASSIAKAYVQIIPSAEGIKGKLSGALNGEASSAGEQAGGSMGTSLVGKLKGIIAAAGIGKMLSESIQAGADMQQSLGGIETLFKDSADTVIKNAEQAYKTAGMSANQYMETVTSFSASLLQGLGGDTEKAASVADMALTDMSDNANKMGTSMESIQNAYQGFAKQNYTMLDNLKLGYGGTKTEMERLLREAQALTGVKYNINNLADVYSAIHAIQGEMDISGRTAEEVAEIYKNTGREVSEVVGTTEKEASSTLSGSLSSMKAAFSDLLANLSLGRDIGPSLNALGETVFTFITGNLIPMVGNILSALPDVLDSALSMAVRGLSLVAGNAGSIVKMGIELVTGIGKSIITALPYLAEAAWNIISSLGDAIVNTDWIQVGEDTIGGLRESLDIAAGEILGTDGDILQSVINAINDGFPQLLQTGTDIIVNLINGIAACLPDIAQTALSVLTSLVNTLVGNLPQILEAGKDILLSIVDGIRQSLPDIIAAAGDAVISMISGLVEHLPDILAAGFDLVVSLIAGIGEAAPDIITAAGDLMGKLWDAIKEIDWLQLGKDIISGLIKGIGAMGNALWEAAQNIAKSALNAIKKFFGIASPSKVMRDQVGKFIPSGLAIGIESNTKPLTDAMHDLSDLTTGTLQADLNMSSSVPAVSAPGYSFGDTNVTLNVYATENQDVDELADVLMDRIQFAVSQREVSFSR